MRKSLLSGNTIYLLLLAMKGFDAIRPEYNCFISMIIYVDTLCGFAPLVFLLCNGFRFFLSMAIDGPIAKNHRFVGTPLQSQGFVKYYV